MMQNEFIATAQQLDLDGNLVTTMRCENCGLWHQQLMYCPTNKQMQCHCRWGDRMRTRIVRHAHHLTSDMG